MKKLFTLFIILWLSLYTCSALATLNLRLVYVAKSGEKTPNNSGLLFSSFGLPELNKGYVSFIGTDTIGQDAVYTNLYGHLATVASTTTQVPGENNTFSSFNNASSLFNTPDSSISSLAANEIVFLGTDHFWQTGLYFKTEDNGIQLLANHTTPTPGTANNFFTAFAHPTALSNGSAAFWAASGNNTQGIYYAAPSGALSKLIDTNTPIPDGTGNFTAFAYPSFSNTTKTPKSFAFVGYGKDKQVGVYLIESGKLKVIANQKTKLPGDSVGYFTGFKDVSYDAATNQIAFIGDGILGQHSLYIENKDKLSILASQNTEIPNGIGAFKYFTSLNMENGFVLFKGIGSRHQNGIYLFNLQGEMLKVLSNTDKINKQLIKNVNISSHALSNNQFAARITFKDGQSGVYLITMINMQQN